MIENQKQLQVTLHWISNFRESKEQIKNDPDIPKFHKYLCLQSIEGMLAELEIDVEVYMKNNP